VEEEEHDDDDELVREDHQHKHILLVVVFELPVFDVIVVIQHNKDHHLLDREDLVRLEPVFSVLVFQYNYPKNVMKLYL